MRESAIEILDHIATEHQEELTPLYEHPDIQPPVKKEYLRELCGDNELLLGVFEDMIQYFYRYTYDACKQDSLKHKGIADHVEEIREMEDPRRSLHNAMIDSVKIFVRHLNIQGKDTTWFDDIDKKSRAGYGQLALLTTYRDIIQHHHESRTI